MFRIYDIIMSKSSKREAKPRTFKNEQKSSKTKTSLAFSGLLRQRGLVVKNQNLLFKNKTYFS